MKALQAADNRRKRVQTAHSKEYQFADSDPQIEETGIPQTSSESQINEESSEALIKEQLLMLSISIEDEI